MLIGAMFSCHRAHSPSSRSKRVTRSSFMTTNQPPVLMSGRQQSCPRDTNAVEVRQVYQRILAGASVRSRDVELDGTALVGHSGGGLWALWYALAHPDRVQTARGATGIRSAASRSPKP
jgi:pimeloyl-ACP methyl ester carboxylesterase